MPVAAASAGAIRRLKVRKSDMRDSAGGGHSQATSLSAGLVGIMPKMMTDDRA
jgi:hypothetical protein